MMISLRFFSVSSVSIRWLVILGLMAGTIQVSGWAAEPVENLDPLLQPSPPMAMPGTPIPEPRVTPPSATVPSKKTIHAPDAQTVPPPDTAQPVNPTEQPAVDNIPIPPAETALSGKRAVEILMEAGVYSTEMENRTTPLTRAEWATVLVKALKHNTSLFSNFPFYRDVPLTHPAYVPIEVAREKQLLVYPAGHGFYYPEKTLLFSDVYQGIAHALTGPLPSPEEEAHLLRSFEDKSTLPPILAASVAKMARSHFFTPESGLATKRLHPRETVTPEKAAPFVVYLMHVIENRADVNQREIAEVPALPANLSLMLSPSTAVMETQLISGQNVYFSLLNAVEPLPKESRIRAVVRDRDPAQHRYILYLGEARTPEDEFFRLNAMLVLTFPPRRRTPFIVPGQVFETQTNTVVDVEKEVVTPVATPPSVQAAPKTGPTSSTNKPSSTSSKKEPVTPPGAKPAK